MKRAIVWTLRKTGTLSLAKNLVARFQVARRSRSARRRRSAFLRANRDVLVSDESLVDAFHHGHWLVAHKTESLRVIDVANANLELTADILDAAGIPYFEIDIPSVNRYRLAVDVESREKLWKHLRTIDDPSIYLFSEYRKSREVIQLSSSSAKSKPSSSAMTWRLFRPMADPSRSFVLGDLQGCEIEFWMRDEEDEALVASRWNSTTGSVRPRDLGSDHTVVNGRAYPSVKRTSTLPLYDRVTFPADIVYTWVDGNDPAWIARKNEILADLGRAPLSVDAAAASRFQDREELRYSLRSVEYFADFVRRVFIVTDQQIPPWLNTEHPLVEIVDHTEIFGDEGQLPTFNSHAIESRLHHVPGLAEHYIYMNDDFFFGRRVKPETFFTSNGLQKFFLSTAHMGLGPPSRHDLGVDNGAKNGRALMEAHFGVTMGRKFKHAPYPQRRSVLMDMDRAFSDAMKKTASHQLRHPEDVATASSVSHYFAYMSGKAVPGKIASRYVNLSDPAIEGRLTDLLLNRNFDSLCINDADMAPEQAAKAEKTVSAFLEAYFPLPSSFELS